MEKAAVAKAAAKSGTGMKRPPAGGAAAKKTSATGAARGTAKGAVGSLQAVGLKQIASALAEDHDLPRRQVEAILSDLVASLAAHLKQGTKVRVGGLGIFQVRSRPARLGRNPATGEQIQIKASKKIAFRPAKELKDAV